MSYKDTLLDPRLQKLVDLGEPGTDIMHGELKNLMYECETKLADISETQDQPEYKYILGRLDALTECYILTYNLAFALNERIVSRG